MRRLSLVLFSFFIFQVSSGFAADYKIISAGMNGSCFKVVLEGKKNTSGSFEVGWQNGGAGYFLRDSYSMLKGKTTTISGCYDNSRAQIPSPTLNHSAVRFVTRNQQISGKYCYIIIDGKVVKTMRW